MRLRFRKNIFGNLIVQICVPIKEDGGYKLYDWKDATKEDILESTDRGLDVDVLMIY